MAAASARVDHPNVSGQRSLILSGWSGRPHVVEKHLFGASWSLPARRYPLQRHATQAAGTALSFDTAKQLDNSLTKPGPIAEAEGLKLANQLQQDGVLRAYGRARQTPKRIYSLDELRLNKIEAEKLLSPADTTIDSVRRTVQVVALVGFIAASQLLRLDAGQIGGTAITTLFLIALDQIGNGGAVEALLLDTAGRWINKDYGRRVASHEAGHFLIAYLLGILPRVYTLSTLDAFRKYGALRVQAGTQFCDAAFQQEVAKGQMSSSSLDIYTCTALAGVCTEYVLFGQSEGGLNDVQQLDGLLRALQFTQKKADAQIRWSVLNDITLLRKYKEVHQKLAEAMASGKSVGSCILLIESELASIPDNEL
ncbi:hypothetical protein WJX84_005555 [Apatococcus fuscideae]|uniref:Uncharacterized protein n=1 Tax=Apatococcus fuscideae TaxID=2026836 RepID=A0AAW1TKM7_9CHLO